MLAEANAPKGSFYYHFPGGKAQLAEVAVSAASDQIVALIGRAFDRAPDFKTGAGELARLVGDWFARSDYREGCPITSVHLETTSDLPGISQATSAAFSAWIAAIERWCIEHGFDPAEARSLAMGLVLAIEGAWILARATRTREPFDVAARMALAPAFGTGQAVR